MKTCEQCGKRLLSTAKFCGECGTKVAPPTCTNCGEELPSAYAYACRKCGTKVARKSTVSSHRSTRSSPPRSSRSTTTHTRRPQRDSFAQPSSRMKVLYIAPSSHKRELRSLFYRVASANRGDVVWVARDSALADTQKELLRRKGRVSCVCLIGGDDAIPFVRLNNPVPDSRGQAGTEDLETDVPYGMLSTPTEEERMTGHVVNDIPVTRIPTLQSDIIERLLSVGDQLSNTWEHGLAVSASVWEGPSTFSLQQISGEHSVDLMLSPPNEAEDVGRKLSEHPRGRLAFNVHGSNVIPNWLGDSGFSYPVVLTADHVTLESNAIVFSEACYGATIEEENESIAFRFLEKGAGCFVGSTIIAWGGVGTTVRRGSGADTLVEFFYKAIDEGLPLGEALRVAKLRLIEQYQDDNGVIDYITHNTICSFVAYGAPFARMKDSARTFEPSEEYTRTVSDYRDPAGDVLRKYRQRLADKLPADVWESLSSGLRAFNLDELDIPNRSAVEHSLTQTLGDQRSALSVSKYRSGTQTRTVIVAQNTSDTTPKWAFVEVDEQGTILRECSSR